MCGQFPSCCKKIISAFEKCAIILGELKYNIILIIESVLDSIIYLTGQPGDVFSPDPSSAEGVIIMSTYEEMQIILTIALLVVAILNLKNKK